MTTRQEKVRGLLKREVSEILRLDMKDPRLGFVTVTDAEVTPDLKEAKVFVTVLGSDDERKASMDVLKSAQRFVRQSLGRRVSMKVLPEIEFEYDTSVDKSIRMQELLEQIDRGGESGQNGATGQNGPVGDNNEADADEQG